MFWSQNIICLNQDHVGKDHPPSYDVRYNFNSCSPKHKILCFCQMDHYSDTTFIKINPVIPKLFGMFQQFCFISGYGPLKPEWTVSRASLDSRLDASQGYRYRLMWCDRYQIVSTIQEWHIMTYNHLPKPWQIKVETTKCVSSVHLVM